MQHKQLEALIIKNFLTVHAVSCYLNIDSTTVLGWMEAQIPVPTFAITALSELDARLSQASEQVIHSVREHFVTSSPKIAIPITTYRSESDFHTFCEEATLFRTLGIHQGFVLRVIAHLKDVGFYAYQVPFEQERYFQKLKSEESAKSFQSIQSRTQKRSDA